MSIILFIFSLLLFIFIFAYHDGASTTIQNLNLTKISNEERYQDFFHPNIYNIEKKTREMFQFEYENYTKYAFPHSPG